MLKIRLQGTTNDIKWFKKILERDKRITVLDISETLVKKITVAENTKIEITFQFEDEMKMLYERLKESCSA